MRHGPFGLSPFDLYSSVTNPDNTPNPEPELDALAVSTKTKHEILLSKSLSGLSNPASISQTLLQRSVQLHRQAHPGFVPLTGRVSRGFDKTSGQRIWQAEQILKSYNRWPPKEGEIFVIQIDQDSPPPPPQKPRNALSPQYPEELRAYQRGVISLAQYLASYSGQTVVFRGVNRLGQRGLEELNSDGPFRSASHTGDFPSDYSCNGNICGTAWLRSGVYAYKGKTVGVFNPVKDEDIWVARDLNGDGAIDYDESQRSGMAYGFAIQIHPGFLNAPRSTGCQTFPPQDFDKLSKIIWDSKVDTFSYVLMHRPNDKTGNHLW